MWNLVKDKINFIIDVQAGKIFNPSGNPTYVNDRFFLYNTQGYHSIGHSEPSLKPLSKNENKKEEEKKRE